MSAWNGGSSRSLRSAGLWLACLGCLSAPEPAQGDLPLPSVKMTFTASDGAATGTKVEIVDAITNAVLERSTFAWARPQPKHASGHYALPRGVHWFEVSAPEHIGRREPHDARAAGTDGVLRVPLLPKMLFLRGRLQPAMAAVVEAPAETSLAPLFPVSADTDADGRFVLAVRDIGDAIALTVRTFERAIVVSLPTATRTRVTIAPHQAIPVATATLALTLSERELAAVAFSQRRLRARAHAEQAHKAWTTAVDAGLAWLVAHQDEDGRWDADGFMKHDANGAKCDGAGDALVDVGVTGLALMALLGEGHSPTGGRYAQSIRRGVEWLLAQRGENDVIVARDAKLIANAFIYQHAMATIALCEAFAAGGDPAWQPSIQRVVDYVEAHRNPYGCWRYQQKGGDNSLSATLWCTLALVAARDAGFTVNPKALEFTLSYVEELTGPEGRTGYEAPGGLSARMSDAHGRQFPADRNEAMTAAGLLLRHALGQAPDLPAVARSRALLARKLPRLEQGSVDYYAWSLGTQAMWLGDDKAWKPWAKAMSAAALKTQREDGNFRGSWDPIDVWGERGGRVYATAVLVLGLDSPWRLARTGR